MNGSINGNVLRDMIISAANNIESHKESVNALNVFPVPDGDTGTNMSMTIGAARSAILGREGEKCYEIADAVASAMMKGARGNSGVILSLLFRGFAKGIPGRDEIDGNDLAKAFESGVDAAYKAVMKPTEGTILTVARLSSVTAYEVASKGGSALEVLEATIETAAETLDKTPDMLPVLKEAGVVDAGGRGYALILEGMRSVLKDGVIMESVAGVTDVKSTNERADFSSFATEDITSAYCTEFIINKPLTGRVRDSEKLKEWLSDRGDSIVFAEDEDIIKIHIHSNHPGRILEESLKYGYLTNLKIENMLEQLAELKETAICDAPPEKKYGFVAVSAGDGISEVFTELMVDNIVTGGQTMNPSTEDILAAVAKTPAETVFVLPNNKNIIMSAQLAVNLSEKEVIVVPTRTIPEGISAMLSFEPDADAAENRSAMQKAASAVKTGLVTYAVRDSEVSGRKVREGEIMGMVGSKLEAVDRTAERAAYKLAVSMVDKKSSFITIFYGKDVTKGEAESLADLLEKKYGGKLEITLVYGGQPVYYYYISVE